MAITIHQRNLFKEFVFLSFFLFCSKSSSQEFSIYTCSPGDEIYSTFGHSAIRYRDSAQQIDWVYNYGLFNFYDPYFIPKFIWGRMDYMVGKEPTDQFLEIYSGANRTVSEQKLNLTDVQRDSLLQYLEWNILEENRVYRYDFLFNNCATKIIDVIQNNCQGVQLKFYEDKKPRSFRQHIHAYARERCPWTDWGMDLGIGKRTDQPTTPREACFLPDYVAKTLDLSFNTINQQPLVSSVVLSPISQIEDASSSWFGPRILPFFTFLMAILYFQTKKPFILKCILFYLRLCSLAGLFLLILWFCTEHKVVHWNTNILWLNPLLWLFANDIKRKRGRLWLFVAIMCSYTVVFLCDLFDIQELHRVSWSLLFFNFMMTIFLFYNRTTSNQKSTP